MERKTYGIYVADYTVGVRCILHRKDEKLTKNKSIAIKQILNKYDRVCRIVLRHYDENGYLINTIIYEN